MEFHWEHSVIFIFIFLAYELPAGLTYHAPTDCLVLNGRPDGVLQFYHPKEDLLKLCVSNLLFLCLPSSCANFLNCFIFSLMFYVFFFLFYCKSLNQSNQSYGKITSNFSF